MVDPQLGEMVDPHNGEMVDPYNGEMVDPNNGDMVDPKHGEMVDPKHREMVDQLIHLKLIGSQTMKKILYLSRNTYVFSFIIDKMSLNKGIWFQNKSFIRDDKTGQCLASITRLECVVAPVVSEPILQSTVYVSKYLKDIECDLLEAKKECRTAIDLLQAERSDESALNEMY
ncbi:unnamed protein product [Mytilus coruscus]|uniref:Uncharacterized protein n=1 Tax=Mytilus coruscus TaxID=42192 RepID=A0A6J8CT15_MYTCO|nr:unnamed protein product [Mytilus coruscus]